jgi:hypothetical protein
MAPGRRAASPRDGLPCAPRRIFVEWPFLVETPHLYQAIRIQLVNVVYR